MKHIWKQCSMAAMACPDLGHLNPRAAASRARRAKLFLYGFALAFAACTAYLAFSSAAGAAGAGAEGSPAAAGWFGGVFASTAPYRSQISNFFSSIFPTNSSSSALSPEKGGGSGGSHGGSGGGHGSVGGGAPSSSSIGSCCVAAKNSSEMGGIGANKRVGIGVPSSNSSGNGENGGIGPNNRAGSGSGVPISNLIGNGSVEVVRSGGNNNAGSGVGARSTNLAGNGSAAAKSGVKNGLGPNNQEGSGSAGNGGAAKSGAKDRSGLDNKQVGSGVPSSGSAGIGRAARSGAKDGTGSDNKQVESRVPSSGSPGNGGAAKSGAKEGTGSDNKQGGTGVPSSGSAGNVSAPVKNGMKDATEANKINDSAGKGSSTKIGTEHGVGSNNLSRQRGRDSAGNGVLPNSGAGGLSNNHEGSGSGVPSNSSAGNVSTVKAGADKVVGSSSQSGGGIGSNNSSRDAIPAKSSPKEGIKPNKDGSQDGKNKEASGRGSQGNVAPTSNQNGSMVVAPTNKDDGIGTQESKAPTKDPSPVVSPAAKNQNTSGNGIASGEPGAPVSKQKEATSSPQGNVGLAKDRSSQAIASNASTLLITASGRASSAGGSKSDDWIKAMASCDMFQGKWVKDDSYPLYPEGSCPHIDEPFDCYLNGRPDRTYQKLRWQPDGCSIPRLDPADMLERLRGKRLVFVGDSLNRNMWESLVCILRNSIKDKKKVFEASGRHEFKTEGSYSFLFTDYNCSVEFFRSPFLVQEWETSASDGKTKETLRLDIIERSSPNYKDADIIIFNTGHWWTHEKTALGKDYYQEGTHVYSELNVFDAFRKALSTWAKWIDANVNPRKTSVFFRGYSASHFSGGQWNSGGSCDKETDPITNEQYLSSYPPKMSILEDVIHGMKTPVVYLNITRMTDYRKDAHPSVYRKQNLTEEERRSPERFQDCSHWCLPGVPDSWNELLYAQFLIKQHQVLHQ